MTKSQSKVISFGPLPAGDVSTFIATLCGPGIFPSVKLALNVTRPWGGIVEFGRETDVQVQLFRSSVTRIGSEESLMNSVLIAREWSADVASTFPACFCQGSTLKSVGATADCVFGKASATAASPGGPPARRQPATPRATSTAAIRASWRRRARNRAVVNRPIAPAVPQTSHRAILQAAPSEGSGIGATRPRIPSGIGPPELSKGSVVPRRGIDDGNDARRLINIFHNNKMLIQ